MDNGDLPTVYALDFGTSNSLLAAANEARTWPPVPIDPAAADPSILRSVLYFPNAKRCYYGEDALRRYAENGLEGRLLRSIKKHLPSRTFNGTTIDDRPMLVEDLIAALLREMRVRADTYFCTEVDRVVLGRPARFCDDALDDAFAERRLAEAARRAGFAEVHFLPEPVAAARELGAGEGEGAGASRVVLVADFGGGTSDFTVLCLGGKRFERSDVLAIGGVAVAGDALDAGIMRHHVARHFGAEVIYKVPFGANVLRMPKPIVEQLCSPANLSILRRQDVAAFLRNVRSWSLGPDDREKLDQLHVLVDDALGFQLFEVIEQAKRALSTSTGADIVFAYPSSSEGARAPSPHRAKPGGAPRPAARSSRPERGSAWADRAADLDASIDVRERVTRAAFEAAVRRETDRILGCLDDTVRAAGVAPRDVDLVCCTGGTAQVPRIADEIRRRFGAERVRVWKRFHAVVEGLAVHARALARGEIDA